MTNSKKKSTNKNAKRPVLVSILCYVLLVEAWFYYQVGHLSTKHIKHAVIPAHTLQVFSTVLSWLSALCVIAAIGLFFMSRIGFYTLVAGSIIALFSVLFLHVNIAFFIPMAVMCGFAWIFRRQYKWFK